MPRLVDLSSTSKRQKHRERKATSDPALYAVMKVREGTQMRNKKDTIDAEIYTAKLEKINKQLSDAVD